MKISAPVLLAILLSGAFTSLEAAQLSFEPAGQTVAIGSPVQVALRITGLGVGAAPSLSVFDLDVSYDPAVLQFDSLSFGDPGLGDQLDLSGFGTSTVLDGATPGVVNHLELSFDSEATLNGTQADAFTLSVFTFTALAQGVTTLGLTINALGDAAGDPLAASVVDGGVSVVPEPGPTALVFAVGTCLWLAVRRRGAR